MKSEQKIRKVQILAIAITMLLSVGISPIVYSTPIGPDPLTTGAVHVSILEPGGTYNALPTMGLVDSGNITFYTPGYEHTEVGNFDVQQYSHQLAPAFGCADSTWNNPWMINNDMDPGAATSEEGIVIHETVNGIYGWTGANYTGSTNTTLTNGNPDYFPTIKLEEIPTPLHAENGTDPVPYINLTWTGLKEDIEEHWFLGPPTWTGSANNVLNYSVYRSTDNVTFTRIGNSSSQIHNGVVYFNDTAVIANTDYYYRTAVNYRYSINDGSNVVDSSLVTVPDNCKFPGLYVTTGLSNSSQSMKIVVPPDIMSTVPANSAAEVPVTQVVSVFYDAQMDATPGNEPVLTQTAGTNPGGWTFNGWFSGDTEAQWTHNAWTVSEELITLQVTGGQDTFENSVITDPHIWSFNIVDIVQPDVSSTVPANTDTGVLPSQIISVIYTEDMDTTAGNRPALTQIGGVNPGGWNFDGWFTGDTEARWSHNDWTSEDTVTMQVTGGLDPTGNSVLTSPFSWTFDIADVIQPDVQNTVPANAAAGVAVGQVISVVYDEVMDSTPGNEPVLTQTAGTDPGGWAFDGWFTGDTEARWSHNDWTVSEESITMQVTGGLDPIGNPVLTDPYSWSFTIEDLIMPDIASTNPVDTGTGVPVNQIISVFYDEAMDDTGGLEPTLTQIGGTNPGGWTFDGWFTGDTEARWSHNDWTVSEEQITMQVTGGQDPAGFPVQTDPFQWSFNVADIILPDVQSTTPANAAPAVAPGTMVIVTYTEPLDTIVNVPILTQTGGIDPGGWIFAGWFTGNTEMRWNHNSWQSEDFVTLSISGGQDLAGNPVFTDPYVWSFTIEDVVDPDVQNTNPANAATAVPVSQAVSVFYNEMMDTTGGLEPTLTQIGGTDPGGWVFAGWFTGDTEARWSHNDWTISEELITMQVTGGVDPVGNPVLTDPYQWSFNVADITSPDIFDTAPATAAMDVLVNQIITVTYDEAMDITAGNRPTLTQTAGTDPGGWVFDGWFSGDTEARWSHNDWTVSEESITMQVTGGLDPEGNPVITDPHSWSFTIADIIPPDVQTTTPLNTALNVAVNQQVSVFYDEEIDTTGGLEPALTQTAGTDPGGWTFDGWFTGDTEARWSHNDWTVSEETVTLQVSGGVDPAGFPVQTDPYSWSFTIEDIIAPDVSGTVPADLITAVPVNQQITVVYDEAMDTTGGLEPTLTQTGGTDPGGWAFDGWFTGDTEARWSHNDWTVSEELITMQVTGGQDPAGYLVLTDPFQWSFTVADIIVPDVQTTSPPDAAIGVAVGVDIIVTYNEEMDSSGANDPILTQTGGTDPGGWAFLGWFNSDTEAHWSHNAWTTGDTITMQITGGADPEGNLVATDPYSWSFDVADAPDVLSTDPSNGITAVAVNQVITITYTKAMDTTGGLEPTLTQTAGTDPGGWVFDGWFNGDTEARWSHNDWTVSEDSITMQVSGGQDTVANLVTTDPYQWSFTIADLIVPDVASTNPANGATGILVNQAVSVFYDEEMDTTGGLEPTLTQTGGTDPGGWVFDGWFTGDTEARWSHNDWTVSEEIIIIQVTGGVDPEGNSVFTDPHSWSFTIDDIILPDVASTSPANTATAVPVGQVVSIFYDEDMDTSVGNIPTLTQTGGTDPGGWVFDGWFTGDTEARWSHNNWLFSEEVITLQVVGGLDPVGNPVFTDPYIWSFTVADIIDPDISNSNPVNGAMGIAVNQIVSVFYDEAMNPTGGLEPVLAQIGGTDPGGWVFDGWFTGDTEARWSHNNWNSEDVVTLRVTGGVDPEGNMIITSPFTWSFTIEDISQPLIQSTVPLDGSTGTLVNADIVIIFSEPMNTGSITWSIAPDPNPGSWVMVWSGGNTILTLSHPVDYIELTSYTVTITGGNDIAGNPIGIGPVPNPWSFTTGTAVLYIVIEDIYGNPILDMDWLTTDNNSVKLFAQAYGTSGYLGNVSVNWAMVGIIGTFNTTYGTSVELDCTTPGIGMIMAYNNGATLIDITGNLTVGLGLLTLQITPSPLTNITADDTQQFQAFASDSDNNIVAVTVTWSLYHSNMSASATNGTLDNVTGLFTPALIGTWTVNATHATLGTVSTTINVTVGELSQIVVDPPFAQADAGEEVTYTINGADAKGNIVAPLTGKTIWYLDGFNVSWSSTPVPTSISSNESGNHMIMVIVGGTLVKEVHFNVSAGAGTHIMIDQTSMTITADETQTFNVSITDAYGNPVSTIPTIIWTAENGTIENGLFTPWADGTWTIYANATGYTGGIAEITVTVGAVADIIINPSGGTGTRDTNLTVGESLLFSANTIDQRGNLVVVPGSTLTWATTIGQVYNGFFTAQTTPGTGVLTVSYGTITVTENMAIAVGTLDRIVVSTAGDGIVEPSEYEQFNAIGYDRYGNEITGLTFAWSASSGSVDTAGLFDPVAVSEDSIVTITATSGGISGSELVYVPAPSGIFSSWLWLVIILFIVVIILVVLLIIGRRKETVFVPEDDEDEELPEEVEEFVPVEEEIPEEFTEPLEDLPEEEELPEMEPELEEELDELEDLDEALDDIKEDVEEKMQPVEVPASVKDELAEQIRLERCEKMLTTAVMLPEDKEKLKALIPTGISAVDFTEEVKAAIERRKKREEEDDVTSDEKASILEDELVAELAELEDELEEDMDEGDLEDQILKEIEDLEDL